jgi:hypothetical protein
MRVSILIGFPKFGNCQNPLDSISNAMVFSFERCFGQLGQLLNGFELRVPHPCAFCKGAVFAILQSTFYFRAPKNAPHPPAASHVYETTRRF